MKEIKKLLDEYEETIRQALLIRKVEEKLLKLFAEGKINGTIHTCIGQELIGVCLAKKLHPDDYVFSNHRGHGHYISRTGDLTGLFAEVMGRETGISGGMGGSQHIHANNYISNGIQGGMTPVAAGVALAFKLDRVRNIAVAFIGDGTLGQGVLYETLNICGIWQLPIIFVLENNGYAQSTSMKQTFAGDLEARIRGFGLRYLKTDTWDLDRLDSAITQAIQAAREEKSPILLEVRTYRLKSHSKGDDNRDNKEIESFRGMDLLTRITESKAPIVEAMLADIDSQVEAAVQQASEAEITKACMASVKIPSLNPVVQPAFDRSDKRINELIYEALKTLFERDERMVMLGEDIEHCTTHTPKPYGGAFKVSRDLSSLFAGRVRNTPISEAAIVGIGTGLALAGKRPVIEIMFGDFITLALDQILNHAAKFCTMFGKKIAVPLVIRTPMGGGRGYGPTHSQSLEKYFLGIPNLLILALNNRIDPKLIYEGVHAAIDTPVLILENKILYTQRLNGHELVGFGITSSDEIFPTLTISPIHKLGSVPDITVVCYGGTLAEAEIAARTAFEDEEIEVEIICPVVISPLNIKPIADSIRKTMRLLTIEEGSNYAAFSSEVISQLAERGIWPKSIRRMGFNDVIPCSFEAERRLLPNSSSILSTIMDLYDEE